MPCLIRFEVALHFCEIGIWSRSARRDGLGGQLFALLPGAHDQVCTRDGMLDLVASLIFLHRLAQKLLAAQSLVASANFDAYKRAAVRLAELSADDEAFCLVVCLQSGHLSKL